MISNCTNVKVKSSAWTGKVIEIKFRGGQNRPRIGSNVAVAELIDHENNFEYICVRKSYYW